METVVEKEVTTDDIDYDRVSAFGTSVVSIKRVCFNLLYFGLFALMYWLMVFAHVLLLYCMYSCYGKQSVLLLT